MFSFACVKSETDSERIKNTYYVISTLTHFDRIDIADRAESFRPHCYPGVPLTHTFTKSLVECYICFSCRFAVVKILSSYHSYTQYEISSQSELDSYWH